MSYDSSSLPNSRAEGYPVPGESRFPENWKEAIPCLIASRIGIFRIEAEEAIEVAVRKLVFLVVAVFCLIATWVLLTAGLVGLISEYFKCAWYFSALSLGGVYLLIAIVMFMIIKRSKKIKTFPITREEFEKDSEWLKQLKNRSNSQS
jgi:uncharacterized membrane protein YqjE